MGLGVIVGASVGVGCEVGVQVGSGPPPGKTPFVGKTGGLVGDGSAVSTGALVGGMSSGATVSATTAGVGIACVIPASADTRPTTSPSSVRPPGWMVNAAPATISSTTSTASQTPGRDLSAARRRWVGGGAAAGAGRIFGSRRWAWSRNARRSRAVSATPASNSHGRGSPGARWAAWRNNGRASSARPASMARRASLISLSGGGDWFVMRHKPGGAC